MAPLSSLRATRLAWLMSPDVLNATDTELLLMTALLAGDVMLSLGPLGAAPRFMSAATSAAVSARLYTCASSMRPAKYSPQIELPPMRNAPVDAAMLPVAATVLTSAPFR